MKKLLFSLLLFGPFGLFAAQEETNTLGQMPLEILQRIIDEAWIDLPYSDSSKTSRFMINRYIHTIALEKYLDEVTSIIHEALIEATKEAILDDWELQYQARLSAAGGDLQSILAGYNLLLKAKNLSSKMNKSLIKGIIKEIIKGKTAQSINWKAQLFVEKPLKAALEQINTFETNKVLHEHATYSNRYNNNTITHLFCSFPNMLIIRHHQKKTQKIMNVQVAQENLAEIEQEYKKKLKFHVLFLNWSQKNYTSTSIAVDCYNERSFAFQFIADRNSEMMSILKRLELTDNLVGFLLVALIHEHLLNNVATAEQKTQDSTYALDGYQEEYRIKKILLNDPNNIPNQDIEENENNFFNMLWDLSDVKDAGEALQIVSDYFLLDGENLEFARAIIQQTISRKKNLAEAVASSSNA